MFVVRVREGDIRAFRNYCRSVTDHIGFIQDSCIEAALFGTGECRFEKAGPQSNAPLARRTLGLPEFEDEPREFRRMSFAKLRALPFVVLLLPLDIIVAVVVLVKDLVLLPLRLFRRHPAEVM